MRASEFVIDDPELCYLDGNSLGRLPKKTVARIQQLVLDAWGKQLIGGWNADWIDLPQRVAAKIAPVVGCGADEIILADSTSVNLFKLATAALGIQQGRKHIVTDATNFPSDLYVLESAILASGGGHELIVVGSPDQVEVHSESIIDQIDASTALVSLSHVTFKSGQLHDLHTITQAAHRVGAVVLWDLSHSAGAVPIELSEAGVDFAVGCTYKYLCGGPGAPAFLYCRRDLQPLVENPIAGWFSHSRPFDFESDYAPSSGMDRFLTGTPPILSLAAVEAGVDLVAEVGIGAIRRRSIELSELLVSQFDEKLVPLGFELRSPRAPERRGSHVSLGHAEARRITQNLIQRHRVVPDFRTPDNLRLGIAPLYNSEADILKCIDALVCTVEGREFEAVELPSAKVT